MRGRLLVFILHIAAALAMNSHLDSGQEMHIHHDVDSAHADIRLPEDQLDHDYYGTPPMLSEVNDHGMVASSSRQARWPKVWLTELTQAEKDDLLVQQKRRFLDGDKVMSRVLGVRTTTLIRQQFLVENGRQPSQKEAEERYKAYALLNGIIPYGSAEYAEAYYEMARANWRPPVVFAASDFRDEWGAFCVIPVSMTQALWLKTVEYLPFREGADMKQEYDQGKSLSQIFGPVLMKMIKQRFRAVGFQIDNRFHMREYLLQLGRAMGIVDEDAINERMIKEHEARSVSAARHWARSRKFAEERSILEGVPLAGEGTSNAFDGHAVQRSQPHLLSHQQHMPSFANTPHIVYAPMHDHSMAHQQPINFSAHNYAGFGQHDHGFQAPNQSNDYGAVTVARPSPYDDIHFPSTAHLGNTFYDHNPITGVTSIYRAPGFDLGLPTPSAQHPHASTSGFHDA